jgi:hypothetical protein
LSAGYRAFVLADDLVLLAAPVRRPRPPLVAAAVAGSVLAELATLERVQVTSGRTVVLLDVRPTGKAVLDETIERLQRMGTRHLGEVCRVMGRVVVVQVEQALVTEGAIVLDELGLFGMSRTKERMVTDRDRLRALQVTLADVLTGETVADARSGSLIALLHAAGWLGQVIAPVLAARGLATDVSATARHVSRGRWVDEPLLTLVAQEQGGAAAAAMGAV